eukprot:325629-Prorocentrum_minimum.AAC.1
MHTSAQVSLNGRHRIHRRSEPPLGTAVTITCHGLQREGPLPQRLLPERQRDGLESRPPPTPPPPVRRPAWPGGLHQVLRANGPLPRGAAGAEGREDWAPRVRGRAERRPQRFLPVLLPPNHLHQR